MHPGHHRGLIVLQLRIVRQVLGEMPEHAGRTRDPDQEQHGADGEHPTEKAEQEPHGRPFAAPLWRAANLPSWPDDTARCPESTICSPNQSVSKPDSRLSRSVLWSN